MAKKKIPATPSIRRLPAYLYVVRKADADGLEYVSGKMVAQELDLEPIQVRKDLAMTGIVGKPKRGYPVKELLVTIEEFLGWHKQVASFVIGAGSLGTALAGYQSLQDHGLTILAEFDNNPQKIGTSVHGIPVFHIDQLKEKAKELKPAVLILTVPASAAQECTDLAVETGISVIWNFTRINLMVPDSISVQDEDLSAGYAMVSRRLNVGIS